MCKRSPTENSKSSDDRTKSIIHGIASLFLAITLIAMNSDILSVGQSYASLEEYEDAVIHFQLPSGFFIDTVLGFEETLSQNQTINTTSIENSTAGENGSIVTLPPYIQLEDRRH